MKRFIALDGEGYTHPETGVHILNLMAASDGSEIVNHTGITTFQALDYLTNLKLRHPKDIFVGFAFKYDADMMLAAPQTNGVELGLSEYSRKELADLGSTAVTSPINPNLSSISFPQQSHVADVMCSD